MSGLKSRNKGKRGERQAAKELNRLLDADTRRGRQFQGGPGSPDVVGLDGIHIEVKYDESTMGKMLYRALQQSSEDCSENNIPIVVGRRNYHNWVLAVELENIVPLARAICKILDE